MQNMQRTSSTAQHAPCKIAPPDRPRRSFGFVAFGNGGILIGLILFAALDRADGGLGFGSGRTGILFSLFGKYRCSRVYARAVAVRR